MMTIRTQTIVGKGTGWFPALVALFLLISGCQSQKDDVTDVEHLSGKELSERFCSSCHLYTPPNLLNKTSWQKVLPDMALRLGLKTGEDPYKGKILEETFYIQQANVFPEEPQLSDSAWLRLVAFYLESAPEHLPSIESPVVTESDLFLGQLKPIALGGFPVVTMVEFDEQFGLYVGDLNGQLVRLDKAFNINQFTKVLAPVVDITPLDDHLLITQIGFLDDNDQKVGLVESTDIATMSRRSLIIGELNRPVHLETVDIDQDGRQDLIVSSFGHLVGDLAWFRNLGDRYEKIVLRNTPGAIKTLSLDADADGDIDIYALFGHGDEGLSLFRNNRGDFSEQKILRFHPAWGTSDFQFVDIDADSYRDVMIVNGDNSDFTSISKPYHGIRLYNGMAKAALSEVLFLPMPGATKAHAHDFDQDGDLDILAHAFYPDFSSKIVPSILYFDNDGTFKFEVHKFAEAPQGRWLVSDIGDIDRDGDMDVVLGSFALGPGAVPDSVTSNWRRGSNHLLFLENRLKVGEGQ